MAEEKKKLKTQLVTPKFRASYANVFTPRMNDLSNKEEYSVVTVFKKGEDLTELKTAIRNAIVNKWGSDKSNWPEKMRLPLKKNEKAAKKENGKLVYPEGYEEGGYHIHLKSTDRPGIVNRDRQPIIDSSEFYSGCFARAQVNVFAYAHKVNKGVSIGLNHIQKWADGDPLGNRVKAEDAFEAIEHEEGGDASSDSADSLFD